MHEKLGKEWRREGKTKRKDSSPLLLKSFPSLTILSELFLLNPNSWRATGLHIKRGHSSVKPVVTYRQVPKETRNNFQ